MMYGTREPFDYVECGACGCLQIAEVPADLGRHYPADYYSFGAPPTSRVQRWAKRQRLRHALGLRAAGGALLARRYGRSPIGAWLAPMRLALDARVLEAGSGAGHLLLELRDAGFTDLTGVDPFLPAEHTEPGLRLLRQTLRQTEGTFDAVMLHHTFEHLPDPAETFRAIHERLRPGGQALIRLPVADSLAFRTYAADWVQLDAPRHLFLHTRESLAQLAADADLAVEHIVCDASAFQFWGSEQYRLDIPLSAPTSHAVDPGASPFSPGQIRAWERQTEALNHSGDGDQACVYLRRRS